MRLVFRCILITRIKLSCLTDHLLSQVQKGRERLREMGETRYLNREGEGMGKGEEGGKEGMKK